MNTRTSTTSPASPGVQHHGATVDSVGGFDVVDCITCQFKHVTPIPTVEQLEQVYRHEYYTAEKPLYLEHVRQDLDWWNVVFASRFDTFESALSADRRRILDVGSGPGFFLKHARDRGWSTLGIEPSSRAAAHAKEMGLDIVEDFLSPQTAPQLGKFDVVHLSEVLEHIPDPAALLRIVHDLLNPGGLIYVEAPNDYSPFQEVLRSSMGFAPWWVVPPHHINYFDFGSLAGLLRRCSFDIVLQEATFPIDMFLLMGDNYIGNNELGRATHAKRKRLELALAAGGKTDLKRALYRKLAEVGIGRDICMYGRKTDGSQAASRIERA
jgi:SAM-dependent methyltransferase